MSLCIFARRAGAIAIIRHRSASIALIGLMTLAGTGGGAQAGPDACSTSGATATCIGDQSTGITNQGGTPDFTTPPVTTLNVNNLTQAIAPPAGVDGIDFENNTGGRVTINSDTASFGSTTTLAPAGIFTQSINLLGNAGAVTVTSTGNITTGDNSDGIGAVSNSSTLGDAGLVAVTSTGNIITGNLSFGILADSFANAGRAGPVTVTSAGNIITGNSSTGISADSTSNVGNAGAVAVTSTGNITTGDSSNGILAASDSTVLGNAAAVAVTSTGNIITGNSSTGISADSTSNVGNAGAVTVTSTGNITTGNLSFGISAASISSSGNSGAVTVNSTGDITVGANSVGILAQSSGTVPGPITVNILRGTLTDGSGTGAAVAIVGGANNTLTNDGTILALSGTAVTGGTGNERRSTTPARSLAMLTSAPVPTLSTTMWAVSSRREPRSTWAPATR